MKLLCLLPALSLLISLTACRQDVKPSAAVPVAADSLCDPVCQLRQISASWGDRTLTVSPCRPQPLFLGLAQAFCSAYAGYVPNGALARYLADSAVTLPDEQSFYVEADTLHRFVKCDMGGQFDYLTALCHWPRADARQLVTVLMQVGHEGETSDGLLLFYGYDSTTHLLRPDTLLYSHVQSLMPRSEGSHVFRLRPEEHAIRVWNVTPSSTSDFVFDSFLLRWDGTTFIKEPLSAPDD